MLKRKGFFTAIHNHLTLALTELEDKRGLLPRIKFYLQIGTPTVIKIVPSCFLLNL